jgi:hypothetical protein
MRSLQAIGIRLVAAAALASALVFGDSSQAQTVPGKAQVRSIKGQATYAVKEGPELALRRGMILTAGTVIKTGPGALVILFLGNSAGELRVTENSVLSLDKLAFTPTGVDTVVEVQLNLIEGQILGTVNKLSATSKYEIKMPNGIAGIRGTRLRCNSNGQIVVLNGTVIFVHVAPNGDAVPYTISGPPPTMFTPAGGVELAPPAVVNEVQGQFGPPQLQERAQQAPQPREAQTFISPTTGAGQ